MSTPQNQNVQVVKQSTQYLLLKPRTMSTHRENPKSPELMLTLQLMGNCNLCVRGCIVKLLLPQY